VNVKEALSARMLQRASGQHPTFPRLMAERAQVPPGTFAHQELREGIHAQLLKKKEKTAMDPMTASFMNSFGDEITKLAAGVAQAAPVAESLAAKLVGAIRRRPVMAATTAAAAGAGAATGIAEVKKKKEETSRRREEIRQLLMSRLAAAGYSS